MILGFAQIAIIAQDYCTIVNMFLGLNYTWGIAQSYGILILERKPVRI